MACSNVMKKLLLSLGLFFFASVLISTVAEGSTVLQYETTQAKIPVSGLTSVSPNCRVTGKISSLAASQEKKNGILSFRPKINKPCTAAFTFVLNDIDTELISGVELTFRFRGPVDGPILSGPKRNVETPNGITFVSQQEFEVSGDGRTFNRFIFKFDSIPRETPSLPQGENGFEALFKSKTLTLEFATLASKKKTLHVFDEMHLLITYYVPSPMVDPRKVEQAFDKFESALVQGATSTTVSSKAFSKIDSRISDLWNQNVGTTVINGGVVQVTSNTILVTGTTTLPNGAVVDVTQGVVTNCDPSTCSVTAVSKICFNAQNFLHSIIKGYVGAQFANLPSAWFDFFVPDFSRMNCVYFSTGETEFEGLSLHLGVNVFLNGANTVFTPLFFGKPLAIIGLIGPNCGEGCIPSQEYEISTSDVAAWVTTPGLTLKSFSIILHEIILLPNDLTLSGIINLSGQDIALSGNYVFGAEITVTASLPDTCWDNPFGAAPFLKLCKIGGSLVFDPRTPKFFVSASITATAIANFSPDSQVPATFIINVEGGIALIVNNLPFGGAIASVVSAANPGTEIPSELNDIAAAVPVIQTLAIATFSVGSPFDIEPGFTIILPIVVSGNFADTLKSIFPNPSAIQLALTLRLSNTGFLLALTLSDVDIYAGMKVVDTSLSLTVPKAAVPTLAIQTGLEVQLSNNPGPLTFIVIGTFQGKSIGIAGAMVGDWVNPFGLRGFTLGDVAIDVGLGPPIPPAIVRFGITAKLTFGTKFVAFASLIDIQQPQQMFLYGEFTGQNGQALTLLDIINLALTVAKKASGKNLQWDLSGVPLNWGLDNVLIKIAPTDAAIGPIQFTKGFFVQGGIYILGIKLQIGIRTYDLVIPGVPVPIPDFNLNFLFDATEFNSQFLPVIQSAVLDWLPNAIIDNALPSELAPFIPWPPPGMDFSKQLFALNYVSITNLGFFNFFTNAVSPKFKASISVLGATYAVDTDITLNEIFGDLETLFEDRVLRLLNIPECITNAECGSGEECNHLDGAWQCVPDCPSYSGQPASIPGIGCVECLTDLDCLWSGSAGPWCREGQCMSQSQCDDEYCSSSTPHCGPFVTCYPDFPEICSATDSSCGLPGDCHNCGSDTCILAECVHIPRVCAATNSDCGTPDNCRACGSQEMCLVVDCVPRVCSGSHSDCGLPGDCHGCGSLEVCVAVGCVGI